MAQGEFGSSFLTAYETYVLTELFIKEIDGVFKTDFFLTMGTGIIKAQKANLQQALMLSGEGQFTAFLEEAESESHEAFILFKNIANAKAKAPRTISDAELKATVNIREIIKRHGELLYRRARQTQIGKMEVLIDDLSSAANQADIKTAGLLDSFNTMKAKHLAFKEVYETRIDTLAQDKDIGNPSSVAKDLRSDLSIIYKYFWKVVSWGALASPVVNVTAYSQVKYKIDLALQKIIPVAKARRSRSENDSDENKGDEDSPDTGNPDAGSQTEVPAESTTVFDEPELILNKTV